MTMRLTVLLSVVGLVGTLASSMAFAGARTYPAAGGAFDGVAVTGDETQSVSEGTTVQIRCLCSTTENLRLVSNAVYEGASIQIALQLRDPSAPNSPPPPIRITIPGTVITQGTGMPYFTNPAQLSGGATVNHISFHPGQRLIYMELGGYPRFAQTINPDGSFVIDNSPFRFGSITFTQSGAPGGYAGNNGVLPPRATPVVHYSTDGSVITVVVTLAGGSANAACRGWFSPLMVFFDDKRPEFSGTSWFPLRPQMVAPVYWVEPNAPGYFLALDTDGDGEISGVSELFGTFNAENGFEILKRHDLNNDGKIDASDPVFSKLLLWRDKNGNGKSEKFEMAPISSRKLVSISLGYTKDAEVNVQGRAKLRERATFQYRNADGRLVTGDVVDVWFSQVETQYAKFGQEQFSPAVLKDWINPPESLLAK